MSHASDEFYIVDDRQVVITSRLNVACDGGGGVLGHPVEYMTLKKNGEVTCPYCGRRYVHVTHPDCAWIRERGQREAA